MEQSSTQDLVVDKEDDVERLLVDKEDGVERDTLIVHSVVVAVLGVGRLLDADLMVVAVRWGVHRDREQDAEVDSPL